MLGYCLDRAIVQFDAVELTGLGTLDDGPGDQLRNRISAVHKSQVREHTFKRGNQFANLFWIESLPLQHASNRHRIPPTLLLPLEGDHETSEAESTIWIREPWRGIRRQVEIRTAARLDQDPKGRGAYSLSSGSILVCCCWTGCCCIETCIGGGATESGAASSEFAGFS